jgi:hypothetical protein
MPAIANLINGITLLPLIDKNAIVYVYAITLELGDVSCVDSHLLNSHNLCLAATESNCYHTCGYQIDDHPNNCVSFASVGHKCNSLGVNDVSLHLASPSDIP